MREKVIFVRNEKFDNSDCVNKFPYEGKSFFAVKSIHSNRYKKFISAPIHNLNVDDFTILGSENININKVKALNYEEVSDYVLGKSKKIPELISFNPKEHTLEWNVNELEILGISKNEIESLGGCYFHPKIKFQVLIID